LGLLGVAGELGFLDDLNFVNVRERAVLPNVSRAAEARAAAEVNEVRAAAQADSAATAVARTETGTGSGLKPAAVTRPEPCLPTATRAQLQLPAPKQPVALLPEYAESLAARGAETLPPKLYHYTRAENVENILQKGLGYDRPLTWTTPAGNLSPVQAQIELALPPNRGYPNALFEIDTATLQQLGINPAVGPQRIMSTPNAAGGGIEHIFNQPIPLSAIKQVPYP